jgi:phosphohistidine phosphatase
MGKQLFVLRHAKSSWEDPGLDDHDRPLAPRGERSAQAMGEHLKTQGVRPAQVLCSTARRTRQTLEAIGLDGEWLIEAGLYAASGQDVLGRLRAVPDDIPSVMVIGHNPAMQMLVLQLVGDDGTAPDGSDLARLQRKFPTGALASLEFDCPWRELSPGSARLVSFVRPKQLAVR